MSEQRGDPAAEAMAHATDPAPDATRDPHAPVAHADAGRPGAGAEADEHGATRAIGDDDETHGGEPLGPIDAAAWGAGILGVALGLAVALCFVIAAGGIG